MTEDDFKTRDNALYALENQLSAKHSLLQKLWEELDDRRSTIGSQHDADSGTYFEDEPWHAEYEKLENEARLLCEVADEYEDRLSQVMDQRDELRKQYDREFVPTL